MSNPWVVKNQNTVNKLWIKLNENDLIDYWQQVLSLRSIFEQASLVKFNLENGYWEMSDIIDYVDNVAFCQIKVFAFRQNHNDFTNVAKEAQEILRSIMQEVKSGKRTKRGEAGKITVDIENHCKTLIDKVSIQLGIQKKTLEKSLNEEEYQTTIDELIKNADGRKVKVNKEYEQARISLGMAYQNRANGQIGKILGLFKETDAGKNQFDYLSEYVNEIENCRYFEEIDEIYKKALWSSIRTTSTLLAIDFLEKEPESLYKYLKLLEPNVRKHLWNVKKENEEFYKDKEEIEYEDLLEYEKIIKNTLLEEQIRELFHFQEEPRPKTKEQLQKELKDAENKITVRTARLQALEDKLENAEKIKYKLLQQIQELSQQRNEELENADREIEQLGNIQKEAEDLLDENITLKSQLKDKQSEFESLQRLYDNLLSKFSQLKVLLQELEIRFNRTTDDYQTLTKKFKTVKTKAIKNKKWKTALRKKLSQSVEELEKELEKNKISQQRIIELEETNTDYKTHLDHAHQDIEKLEDKLKKSKDKSSDLAKAIEEWITKCHWWKGRFLNQVSELAEETKQDIHNDIRGL